MCQPPIPLYNRALDIFSLSNEILFFFFFLIPCGFEYLQNLAKNGKLSLFDVEDATVGILQIKSKFYSN